MNYSPQTLSQHSSGNFIKNFFHCINSRALLICTFWRWKSPLRDPYPVFFSAILSVLSLTHTHLHNTNKRQPVSVPPAWDRVREVRLPGPDCSQTLWWSSVSLHLTPCQHEVTEPTRQTPTLPPTSTCFPTEIPYWSSRRGMLSLSWDERGSRGQQDDNRWGRRARK